MQQSSHYGFNKPDYADQYDLRHWNENTDSLDTILNNNGISPNNDANALGNRIDAEKTARENADSVLQGNITSEATTRGNADTAIRNDIGNGTLVAKKAEQDEDGNNIKSTYATKDELTSEGSTRSDADVALGGRIDGIVDGTTTVKKAYQDKDGNNIDTTYQKTTNRVNSWQSTPDNTHYPSEKLVKDSLDDKANKISNASNGAVPMMDSNGQLASWHTQLNSLVCSYNANFQNRNIIENSFSSTQYSTITMSANLSRRVRHGSSEDYFFDAVGMAGYKLEVFNDSNYTQASDAILMPTEMYIYESKFYFKGIFLKEKTHSQGQPNTVYVRITVYAFTEPTIYQEQGE